MKKILLSLSLITLTSVMASEALRTEMSLTAGYNKFDSASILDDTPLFGIRTTMYETQANKYGFQLGYQGMTGVDYAHVNKKTDIHRLYAHMVVDGDEEYRVTPYLLLGGGYEYLSDEVKGEPSQGFIDTGIGFKYYLNNYFNLTLEALAIGKI